MPFVSEDFQRGQRRRRFPAATCLPVAAEALIGSRPCPSGPASPCRARLASGMMTWLYTWASALPCPPKPSRLSRSPSTMPAQHVRGAFSFIQLRQRRAEIEADPGVVVDESTILPASSSIARRAVGRVALRADALVPVVVGSGGILDLDRFKPGILPRRLIEMAVNAQKALRHVGHASASTVALPVRDTVWKTKGRRPRRPLPPDPSPEEGGGSQSGMLPLSLQGRGLRGEVSPAVGGVTRLRLPQLHLDHGEALGRRVLEDQPGDVLGGRVDVEDVDRLALLPQERQHRVVAGAAASCGRGSRRSSRRRRA